MTIAKALGNGVPIGACWARSEVAGAFVPGDHASTFGGQPLAASAAAATLGVMEQQNVPRLADERGNYLGKRLAAVDGVASVRGLGLLLAAELVHGGASEVAAKCLKNGLVLNAVTATALRLEPPLLITNDEIDEGIEILAHVLEGT